MKLKGLWNAFLDHTVVAINANKPNIAVTFTLKGMDSTKLFLSYVDTDGCDVVGNEGVEPPNLDVEVIGAKG